MKYSRTDDLVYVRSSKLSADAAAGWQVVEDLPGNLPTPFEQWVSHIQNGTTASDNIQLALDLTRLMEATTRSAQTGTAFYLRDLTE